MARYNYHTTGMSANNAGCNSCTCVRTGNNGDRISCNCRQRKKEHDQRALIFFAVAGIFIVLNILLHLWLLTTDVAEKTPGNYPVHSLFVRLSLVTGIDSLVAMDDSHRLDVKNMVVLHA